ncbi:GntR family transcriptional regulator [Salipiger pallidus]|uniref:GntR family transcriptional regulator n=1 Tax=Salipiger pallidus TaxID=1775170 RepID=A0A8J2ZMD9_9RHOB|nr:GntR family transcriptional regulator [Salipiger pallidus]GGG82612.1 GntR family transcriptional regulator [Salipiger pallidus]
MSTLADNAYLRLREDIVTGRIAAETVLSERGLTEVLGVSRTPLRTALGRLERDGMVDRLANGVILVRSVTVEQLLQIVQLRQRLEGAAAGRAAQRGTTARLTELRDAMARLADGAEVTFDAFWVADGTFHKAVAEAAGLRLLPNILDDHRAIARRCTLTRTYDTFTEQAREHVEIADAIAAGDADAATALMQGHFEHVQDRFLGTFKGR